MASPFLGRDIRPALTSCRRWLNDGGAKMPNLCIPLWVPFRARETLPGVYRIKRSGKVVYVGQSTDCAKRIRIHMKRLSSVRNRLTADYWTIDTKSQTVIDALEAALILRHRPACNSAIYTVTGRQIVELVHAGICLTENCVSIASQALQAWDGKRLPRVKIRKGGMRAAHDKDTKFCFDRFWNVADWSECLCDNEKAMEFTGSPDWWSGEKRKPRYPTRSVRYTTTR